MILRTSILITLLTFTYLLSNYNDRLDQQLMALRKELNVVSKEKIRDSENLKDIIKTASKRKKSFKIYSDKTDSILSLMGEINLEQINYRLFIENYNYLSELIEQLNIWSRELNYPRAKFNNFFFYIPDQATIYHFNQEYIEYFQILNNYDLNNIHLEINIDGKSFHKNKFPYRSKSKASELTTLFENPTTCERYKLKHRFD